MRVACLLLVLGLAAAFPVMAIQVEPLSLDETIRRAETIAVGTITGQQTRWADASQRWMLTDYTLAVEEVVHGAGAETLVLTYWGGTIGDRSQGIAGLRLPAQGERLVVMLDRVQGFAPTVGLNQGLFRIVNGAVVDGDGRAVERAATGQLRFTDAALGNVVDLATFAAWLRSNAGSIKTAPPEPPTTIDWSDPRLMKTSAAIPELPGFRPGSAGRSQLPAPGPSATATPTMQGSANSIVRTGPPKVRIDPEYVRSRRANFPIVVNQFPTPFGGWSPYDQYVMSTWNYYADVFRVYVTPTGTYGWSNGRWDLAGWPISADMQQVYGYPWPSNVLGVCFWSTSGDIIVEADIALNPNFAWTLDDEWVHDGSFAYSFRETMSHELGHMHGLDHNFQALAVMNYLPSRLRFFALPFMDDAAGLRGGYPARTMPGQDLAVYLFQWREYARFAFYPSLVWAGEREGLHIKDFRVENVGTTTIDAPTVHWFLTAQKNFNAYYYHLTGLTYGPLAPGQYHDTIEQFLTVPSDVPSGWYWLAAYIPNDGGANQGSYPFNNNYAFSHSMLEVFQCPQIWAIWNELPCHGNSVQLNSPYFPNASYTWAGPNGFTAYVQNPMVGPLTHANSGEYTVTIEYRGCTASASTTITVNPPPAFVSATAVSATRVELSWTDGDCAVGYEIYRSSGNGFAKIGTSVEPVYTDLFATANTAYLYAIRSIDPTGNVSPLSYPDLATTVVFIDPNINPGVTHVKAAHVRELRTAVGAVRALAGLAPMVLTDPTLTAGVTKCKVAHVTELREALDAARETLGLPPMTYFDPTLTPGVTPIDLVHIVDLRQGVW